MNLRVVTKHTKISNMARQTHRGLWPYVLACEVNELRELQQTTEHLCDSMETPCHTIEDVLGASPWSDWHLS